MTHIKYQLLFTQKNRIFKVLFRKEIGQNRQIAIVIS